MAKSSSATKKKSSSTAKKRPVAAKRKSGIKPVPPSSSSLTKSAKAKAKRGGGAAKRAVSSLSNRKRKSSRPEPPAVVLPSDWPVASRPPSFPEDASALRPGSLLQQTCSGQDIQLVRSASAVPSFEKEKGKFLLVFPGNFSFGSFGRTTPDGRPDAAALPGQAEATPSEDGKPSPEKNHNDGSTTNPGEASKTTATPSTTMGRIEGLRTNTPSFRIPFPHLQKSLVFPGKKISTTSKYLALSCSNKKNGTVQCKNIFSSAVVFGMPKWESSADNGTVVSTPIVTATGRTAADTASSTAKSGDVSAVSPSAEEENNDEKNQRLNNGDGGGGDENAGCTFLHYGGSERTVDGATRSTRKSSGNTSRSDSENNADVNDRVPIWSNHSNSNKPFDFSKTSKPESNATTTAVRPKTAKSYDTSSDDEVQYSDSDGDYDALLKIGSNDIHTPSSSKTRLPRRRQASMTKKKYAEEEEDVSNDDDDDTDQSDCDQDNKENDTNLIIEKEPAKKKEKLSTSKGGKTPPASSAKKQQQKQFKGKASNPKTRTKKAIVPKKAVIDVDDGSDYDGASPDSFEMQEKKTAPSSTQRRSVPERKSRCNQATDYKEINESDIQDSESGDEDDDDSGKENTSNASSEEDACVPRKPKKIKKGQEAARKSPPVSAKPTHRSKSIATKTPSSKGKAAPPKSKSASATPGAKSARKRPRNAPPSQKNRIVLENSSTPSPGAKSPFRRRHKKTSPVKKARTSILDLTQDDEFAFG